MTRLVIDPVTRVGGHLRIEAEVERGVVTGAWVAATMYRGMEGLLVGRDPRDAWLLAGRTCGTSVGAHALASVRAVEDALDVTIPPNARLVRNVLAATSFLIDHVTGFYGRLAPDWIDLEAALRADMFGAAELGAASWTSGGAPTAADLASVRDRVAALADAGDATPFGGLPARHPASTLDAEAAFLLVDHGLRSLDWARALGRVEAILGGKVAHPQTLLVGGVVLAPPWNGTRGAGGGHPDQTRENMPTALGPDGLTTIRTALATARRFIDEVYLPDVLRLARASRGWSAIGVSGADRLAFGAFPEADGRDVPLLLPRGRLAAGEEAAAASVEDGAILEATARSWYEPEATVHHPAEGVTKPRYAGPELPLTSLAGAERYSWSKAPRYADLPMETGPLSRVHVALAEGGREVRRATEGVLASIGAGRDALEGTLGRILATAIETEAIAARLPGWLGELDDAMATGDAAFADVSAWAPARWPRRVQGASLGESPRGALGHWVGIADERVAAYGIVDGSTWNLSPRDGRDVPGPLEAALVGTPVADETQPVEVLRVVHSFDPCTACGVH